jgi:hypothetical protein
MGNSVSTPARALGVSTERAGGVVVENQPHPTSAAEAGREGKAGAASVDDCPVLRGREATNAPDQYDVYNQRIDPRNNMPLAANQAPFPGQKALLSTERIQSNIPKGGTKSTWVYPSPQMFYNALKVRLPYELVTTLAGPSTTTTTTSLPFSRLLWPQTTAQGQRRRCGGERHGSSCTGA